MSCFQPKILYGRTGDRKQAQDGHYYQKYHITKPYKTEKELEMIILNQGLKNYNYEIIPCGKCIGCRLDYSRTWANRGYLESKMWQNNYFVTITYNEENLPENKSLVPEHLTNFIKKLRRNGDYNGWQHTGIRYIAAGEYGDKLERPHYHLILFNCNLPTESFYEPHIIKKETFWRNNIIEECWKYGYSSVSNVSWNNIAYVARYITKKQYGEKSKEHYGDRQPEFFRASRKPGIGMTWLEEHMEEVYATDEIIVQNRKGSIKQKPPRAFDKKLKEINEKEYEKIRAKRKKIGNMTKLEKAQHTSLTMAEQLEVEETSKIAQATMLKRMYESG